MGKGPSKLRSEMNQTKVSPKILFMKSSGNNFIFLSTFYLIRDHPFNMWSLGDFTKMEGTQMEMVNFL